MSPLRSWPNWSREECRHPVSTSIITLKANSRWAMRHIGPKRLTCLVASSGGNLSSSRAARSCLACDPHIRDTTTGRMQPEEGEDAISRATMAFVVSQISGYLAKSWLLPCGLKLRKPAVARPGLLPCRCGTSGRFSAGSSHASSISDPSKARWHGCRGSPRTWRYRHSPAG